RRRRFRGRHGDDLADQSGRPRLQERRRLPYRDGPRPAPLAPRLPAPADGRGLPGRPALEGHGPRPLRACRTPPTRADDNAATGKARFVLREAAGLAERVVRAMIHRTIRRLDPAWRDVSCTLSTRAAGYGPRSPSLPRKMALRRRLADHDHRTC